MTATTLPAAAETAADRRRELRARPAAQRGQVLVLFILIFATCCLAAAVAATVGQVVVRRHQAQMVVDAAAFAGAAKQAEGLNTIAHYNQMSFTMLNIIYGTSWVPFMDKDSTTYMRIFTLGIPSFFINDWAGDILKSYQKIFDTFDGAINLTNCLYSNALLPRIAAEDVINANFGNSSDKIFKSADKKSSGYANPADWVKNGFPPKLVKLTNRDTYKGHGYTYVPYVGNEIVQLCAELPFPADLIPCGLVAGGYGSLAGFTQIYRNINPISYKTGRFYNQSSGDDVRFEYQLTVTATKPMFGRTFFNDIPEITVMAAAKPYNGYLGKKFTGGYVVPFFQATSIKETYQAKLVPLKTADKILLVTDPMMALRTIH